MNIYDKKQVKCSICGKSIGEIDVKASIIYPLCKICSNKEKRIIRKGINKILVPVDTTTKSVRALDTATYIAKHLGSSITLIQVIPEISGSGISFYKIVGESRRIAEKSIKYAKNYCEHKNITTNHRIVHGDEAEEIVKTAKKSNYDLIVMGSSGKGIIKEAFFGSISNYVMHNSNIPVLIVKETSANLDTKIDKNMHESSQKPGRQGSGTSFATMKKRAGLK
jgi:nucleotide-binding universal stress UspA family protein